MTEQDDPFKDLKDPFVPETVRVQLGDGRDAVDLGATAMNHVEAPLPQVSSSNMREGDVLTVEFDSDHQETFEVAELRTGSLVFGSDDVRRQEVILKRQTEDGDEQPHITLYGSAISPSGMMRTPGVVRAGSYMMTDEGVSTGAIRTFDLKRPDENGDLKHVMLNKKESKAASESFSQAKSTFEALEALLKEDGFTFGDVEEDKILPDGYVLKGGSYSRYKKVNGDLLVYAARQGFGCAVTPQDEIWVYDAKNEVLRSLRNIPSEGVIQMAVAEGVTKDIFQKAGNGYGKDGNTPDWREPFLDGVHIHWLSDSVPVTSYTWLSPDQKAPIMTVLEDGQNVSKLFQTPKQKGATFVENMKAHGGDDLIDSVHEMLGIDPNDSSHVYDNLEVNIYPGERQIKPRVSNPYLWTSEERASAFAHEVQESTTLRYQKEGAVLTVDGHNIHIKTDTEQEIDKMAKAARLALGATQKAIGSRLVGRLRTRRRQ